MSNNRKGYNNPDDWESIEEINKKTKINKNADITDAEFSTTTDEEDIDFDNLTSTDDDFSDVLQLTEFETGLQHSSESGINIIAEYADIDILNTTKKHQVAAKAFVSKITKFVLDFNDVTLSEEHKKYIKQVGSLQYQHLADLLYLADVNKQMIDNIVHRVNATMVEDYAIVNAYNNLLNQHLKLIKELQNTYKSIPSTIKKMRTEVLCNQELGDIETNIDDVITEEYGDKQFNNGKQLLRSILAKREGEQKEELE